MALLIRESGSSSIHQPSSIRGIAEESPWRKGLRTLARSKTATVGTVVIAILLVLAVIGPTIAPYDPVEQGLLHRHEAPSWAHWLGTDQLGRDLLSRILYGARLSLTLSVSAIVFALVVGIPIGLFSGYFGGLLDTVIMGFVDILLAFPTYLLAIFVVAVRGPSLINITLAVGIATLPTMIRIVRGDTLGMKSWEHVVAARCIGAPTWRIVFRHILPNILNSIAVVATLRLGGAILVVASLSFLGLGISPPTPAWGLMINEGLRYLTTDPRIALVPGGAIMITVLGFNLFGDGLRDALDPHLRGTAQD